MTMNRREKGLLAATVVAVIGFFCYQMGWHTALLEAWENISAPDSVMQREKDSAQHTLDVMKREKEANAAYARKVRSRLRSFDPSKTPEGQFSEDVDALRRGLNITNAKIDPPKREPIPDVSDYEYVVLNFSYDKTWPEVAQLLQSFDQNSFLIKELNIAAPLDRGSVKVDVRLARVVRITEAEKKKRLEAGRDKGERRRESAGTLTP